MADALQSTLRHPKKITKTTLNNIKKTLANASVFSIHQIYLILSQNPILSHSNALLPCKNISFLYATSMISHTNSLLSYKIPSFMQNTAIQLRIAEKEKVHTDFGIQS